MTIYELDSIWGLVYSQFRQEDFSEASSDYAMFYFDDSYQYALEHMRFAHLLEVIAEYAFNGILAEWTKQQRLLELKGGD